MTKKEKGSSLPGSPDSSTNPRNSNSENGASDSNNKKRSGKRSGNVPLHVLEKEDLTPRQRETYKIVSKGTCLIDEIRQALNIKTNRGARKHLEVLRKKGLVKMHTPGFYTLPDYVPEPTNTPLPGGTSSDKKLHNLHGEQFSIRPINPGEKYSGFVDSRFIFDGNTVHVYEDSVQVYSNKRFWSDSPRKCSFKAVKYWNRFLNKLEQHLGVVILKEGYNNVERVQAHYEETENGISKQSRIDGDRVRLYAPEDGKLWLEFDNSLGMSGMDTTHKRTAERDMAEVMSPFLNDLRKTVSEGDKVPTMSELKNAIFLLVKENRETAMGLNSLVELLKPRKPEDLDLNLSDRPGYVG